MAGLGIARRRGPDGRWSQLDAARPPRFDAIDTGVGGYHLAQLAIGVLGVLVISGEYSTGMIRSSLMAVPRRLPVLWAKLAVFAAVTFVLDARVGVRLVLRRAGDRHAASPAGTLGDPHALRAVIGTALFLTVLGVLAVGLGALVRNTAGGIAPFVGLLFVLPGHRRASCRTSTADAINPYLPLNAGFAVATSTFENSHHLAPWTGFAVFCGYAALAVAAAAIGLLRRDA